MRLLPNGNYEIKNKKTNEVKQVKPEELGKYGLSVPEVASQPTQQTTKSDTTNQPNYITGRSLEEHSKALQRARAAGDTTAEKDITDDYTREFEYQKTIGTYKQPDALTDTKKKDAASLVNELEKLYYGNPDKDQSLAFAQPDVWGGRLEGTKKNIERILKPGGKGSTLERLNTFKRTLESKRAFLAKAAGDAGNIALQEQILAGKGLPDENSTVGESLELFKSMRGVYGMPDTDIYKKAYTKYGGQEVSPSGTTGSPQLDKVLTPGSQGQQPPLQTQQPQGTMPIDKHSAFQESTRLAKMAIAEKDPKKKQDLIAQSNYLAKMASQQPEQQINPLIEKLGLTQKFLGETSTLPVAGGILGQVVGGPLGAGAGTYYGTKGKQMLQTGGIEAFLPSAKKDNEALKEGAKATAWSFGLTKLLPAVFQPGKTLGQARNFFAGKSNVKIATKPVIDAAENYLKDIKVTTPLSKDILSKLKSVDEISVSDALGKLDKWGKLAYTKGGDVKSKAEAQLLEYMYGAIRKQIAEKTPGISTIQNILSVGHKVGRKLGYVGRGVGYVTGAGLGYKLLESLGIRLPGVPTSE